MYDFEYISESIKMDQELFEINCLMEHKTILNEGVGDAIGTACKKIADFFRFILDKIKEIGRRIADFFRNIFSGGSSSSSSKSSGGSAGSSSSSSSSSSKSSGGSAGSSSSSSSSSKRPIPDYDDTKKTSISFEDYSTPVSILVECVNVFTDCKTIRVIDSDLKELLKHNISSINRKDTTNTYKNLSDAWENDCSHIVSYFNLNGRGLEKSKSRSSDIASACKLLEQAPDNTTIDGTERYIREEASKIISKLCNNEDPTVKAWYKLEKQIQTYARETNTLLKDIEKDKDLKEDKYMINKLNTIVSTCNKVTGSASVCVNTILKLTNKTKKNIEAELGKINIKSDSDGEAEGED